MVIHSIIEGKRKKKAAKEPNEKGHLLAINPYESAPFTNHFLQKRITSDMKTPNKARDKKIVSVSKR